VQWAIRRLTIGARCLSVGSIEHFDVPNYHLFLTAGEHAVI
jgi:hypothetical protein